jgi:hypothetical protein
VGGRLAEGGVHFEGGAGLLLLYTPEEGACGPSWSNGYLFSSLSTAQGAPWHFEPLATERRHVKRTFRLYRQLSHCARPPVDANTTGQLKTMLSSTGNLVYVPRCLQTTANLLSIINLAFAGQLNCFTHLRVILVFHDCGNVVPI